MRKLSPIKFLAGTSLSLIVAAAIGFAADDLSSAGALTAFPSFKLIQQAQAAEKGHEHEKGHNEHKDGKDHKDNDEHKDDKGHKDHDDHKDGEGHKDHDDHKDDVKKSDLTGEEEGHGHKEDGHKEEPSSAVRLSQDQIELAGIQTVTVSLGQIGLPVKLAGEVGVNKDRVIEVVPKVSGVVASVHSYLGDRVEKGHVMAVIDSREFANSKSAYVAARERAKLSRIKYEREERLWQKKITSEQEFLDAKIAKVEAEIAEHTAAQKLLALGVSAADLKNISNRPDQSLTRYEIVSPLGGTIIEKHVTAGASVDEKEMIFQVADLKTLWVIASVYEKDLARIRKGQFATITTKAYPDQNFGGRITWIASTIEENTRTLKVRIEVDNSRKLLKPGMFVRASVVVDVRNGVLTVPVSALRRQGGETIVFVDQGGGRFERRDVKPGVRSGQMVEVVSGLKPGQRVVSAGSFLLKSELEKEGFEAGHAH